MLARSPRQRRILWSGFPNDARSSSTRRGRERTSSVASEKSRGARSRQAAHVVCSVTRGTRRGPMPGYACGRGPDALIAAARSSDSLADCAAFGASDFAISTKWHAFFTARAVYGAVPVSR